MEKAMPGRKWSLPLIAAMVGSCFFLPTPAAMAQQAEAGPGKGVQADGGRDNRTRGGDREPRKWPVNPDCVSNSCVPSSYPWQPPSTPPCGQVPCGPGKGPTDPNEPHKPLPPDPDAPMPKPKPKPVPVPPKPIPNDSDGPFTKPHKEGDF